MESVDKVHGIHGHCPAGVLERKHWTISSESMENVDGVFPVYPWNFSSMSMEFFHGIHGRDFPTFSKQGPVPMILGKNNTYISQTGKMDTKQNKG